MWPELAVMSCLLSDPPSHKVRQVQNKKGDKKIGHKQGQRAK